MKQNKIHFENLDGLRFFAAFAVICSHLVIHLSFPKNAFYNYIKTILFFNGNGGNAGVYFFFVLSGFLITYLMLAESSATGSFHVPRFYLRRVLRIWPLYFLTLIVGFVIYPLLTSTVETANWLLYASFLTNFDHIALNPIGTGILGVQWSVAIEEQFYLVWPLLFFVVREKKHFLYVIILIILLSNFYQALYINNDMLVKYHTLCAFNDLSVGALFAWLSYYKLNSVQSFFSRLKKPAIFLIYIAGSMFLYFKYPLIEHIFIKYSYRFISSLFFAFIILEQNYSPHSLFKTGTSKYFTKLGKISYGLYLLHMIAITFVIFLNSKFNLPIGVQIILSIVLSISLAALSYKYFEKFFLVLKNKYAVIKTKV